MRSRFALASVAVIAVILLAFQPTTGQAPAQIETVGEISPISLRVNGQGVNHGFPDLIRDSRGDFWCAYVSARVRDPLLPFNVGKYEEGDFIVVRRKRNGEWSDELVVSEYFGVNFNPALAEDPDGNVFVVWTGRHDNEFALYSRRIGPDLSLGSQTKVLTAGELEGKPSLTRDSKGTIWLAAQSYRRGSMDIVFYELAGSGWRQAPDVSSTPAPEFRPRLATAPDGKIHCVWDAYEQGKYRIKWSVFDPAARRWGEARNVPGDGELDAYAADVTVDSEGRVWVAYARNSVHTADYGLRGGTEGRAPLPTIRVAVRDSDGTWKYPSDEGLVDTGDLPRIEVGPNDSIWVSWQRLYSHVDWKVGLAVFKGDGWTAPTVFGRDEPIPIDGPARRADQLPSFVVTGPDEALVAYQHGRGTFRNRDIYERSVRAPGVGAGKIGPSLTAFAATDLSPKERLTKRPPRRDPVFDSAGGRYRLYFGDLHNHLLVDDGHQGSVDQLFNIHRDRYGSDFAATTSHGDSNKLLISELANNDALTQALLEDERFVTIPGFEWTQGDFVVPRAGHRHVIYETPGGPLYRPTEGFSDSIREFVDLMAKTNGMIFAHHLTRDYTSGTDWSYVNIKVEPAAEMCSSWGRFEYYQNPGHIRTPQEMKGCSMQDAWAMGWRLGVIGGSDGHNLYGDPIQGLTGVYSEELTRKSLFDAIRKRHIYATTGEPIELVFKVNGALMGSELTANDGPLIEATVKGTRKLIGVEVIKYWKGAGYPFPVVHKAQVEGDSAKVWWRDDDFKADSMYYLRVTQEVSPALAKRYADRDPNPFPTEMAWSSPVWVDKE